MCVRLRLMLRVFGLLSGFSCLIAAQLITRPELAWKTVMRSTGSSGAGSIVTDRDGNIYIAGATSAVDFPTTKNAFQSKLGGTHLRSSTDGGRNWKSLDLPETPTAIGSPSTIPNLVLVGTASGIYKSTDGMATFSLSKSEASGATVQAFAFDEARLGLTYAATSYGVLISFDLGSTWVFSGAFCSANSVAVVPSGTLAPSTILAACSSGKMLRSRDNSRSWQKLGNAPEAVSALAADPARPNILFAACGQYSPGGLFKSTDSGETWALVHDGPVSTYTSYGLAVSSTTVYILNDAGFVERSTDSGATWKTTELRPDARSIAIDPADPDTAYVYAEGLWKTQDRGGGWALVPAVRQPVALIAAIQTAPAALVIGADYPVNGFVSKWSPDGKTLIYSTYLGGSHWDAIGGIAVDTSGNAYVTGQTVSNDFPVTANAIQKQPLGSKSKAFVAKLSADGSTLQYSTYLGGSSGSDGGNAIDIDSNGAIYVAGSTFSDDFPTTSSAFQQRFRQQCPYFLTYPYDLSYVRRAPFVTKLTSSGALAYSTLLGGSCSDYSSGIRVDAQGSVWLVGSTNSPDFPTTKDALESSPGKVRQKGFLAKLSQGGDTLSYSTLLGNQSSTTASALTMDAKGNLYITGTTFGFDNVLYSPPAPANPGGPGFSKVGPNLSGTPFVLKLDPTGKQRIYLAYPGKQFAYGSAYSIAVNDSGQAWISGEAAGAGWQYGVSAFPLVHPFQASGAGFVSQFSADGSELLFSTRMDYAGEVSVDRSGNTLVAGTSLEVSAGIRWVYQAAIWRVDRAATKAMTLEAPAPISNTIYLPDDDDGLVARGEIILLTGSGLGPADEIRGQAPLPTSLGGTTVYFDGVAAPLLSVRQDRILCVVPFSEKGLSLQPRLQVERSGNRSNTVQLRDGYFMMQVLGILNEDGSINSEQNPAKSNSTISVYATGLGASSPASVDGEINSAPKLIMPGYPFGFALLGGNKAKVLYAGAAPGEIAGVIR